MEKEIRNQISDEIFSKIVKLETEKNQEKQKAIAKEIIDELDIEDFTPYMAYNNDGDIFIALDYYSSQELKETLTIRVPGNFNVALTSKGVYVLDAIKGADSEY